MTPDEARWIELGDGVFARRYGELDLTTGLVVGAERCLVVDTRGDLEQGGELAAAVRAVTALPWSVVYTHGHFDHSWGTERFLPCDAWGHDDCRAELTGHVETVRAEWIARYRNAGKSAVAEALARTTVVPPNRTLTGRAELDLGGRAAVLLHPGPAHTGHDVVVHVPEADVLFAGDVVEHADAGFSADSFGTDTHLDAWPGTLDVLLGLLPRIIVPGHGEPVDQRFLREQRNGLRELAALHTALRRGELTRQSAVAAAPYPAEVAEAAFATR